MQKVRILKLSEHPEWIGIAAAWFHEKWGVPKAAYQESMEQSLKETAKPPAWFIVLSPTDNILAGVGIIDNDFHDRPDLTPNVCALYVEPEARKNAIARQLLHICRVEAGRWGFETLYLVTDHTEFYEKCGWKFLMMVNGNDGVRERMYWAKANEPAEHTPSYKTETREAFYEHQ